MPQKRLKEYRVAYLNDESRFIIQATSRQNVIIRIGMMYKETDEYVRAHFKITQMYQRNTDNK